MSRVIVIIVLLATVATSGAHASISLSGTESMTVDYSHGTSSSGILRGSSFASLTASGFIAYWELYDSSGLEIGTTGWAAGDIQIHNQAKMTFSSGSVTNVRARDQGEVRVTGGSMVGLATSGNSTATVTGGSSGSVSALESSKSIFAGGSTEMLRSFDSATVTMSGGTVRHLGTYDEGRIEISGGTVTTDIFAYNTSSVVMTGGSVGSLYARDNTTFDISGGSITYGLYAYEFSTVRIHGSDFDVSNGLKIEGNEVTGTGILSGKWLDGSDMRWSMIVSGNHTGALIQIPEPATFGLVGVGWAMLLLRQRQRAGKRHVNPRGD